MSEKAIKWLGFTGAFFSFLNVAVMVISRFIPGGTKMYVLGIRNEYIFLICFFISIIICVISSLSFNKKSIISGTALAAMAIFNLVIIKITYFDNPFFSIPAILMLIAGIEIFFGSKSKRIYKIIVSLLSLSVIIETFGLVRTQALVFVFVVMIISFLLFFINNSKISKIFCGGVFFFFIFFYNFYSFDFEWELLMNGLFFSSMVLFFFPDFLIKDQ